MILSLIALHVLSGGNSEPMMYGTDISKVLKAASKVSLRYIGDMDANLEDVMREGKQFCSQMLWAKSIKFI